MLEAATWHLPESVLTTREPSPAMVYLLLHGSLDIISGKYQIVVVVRQLFGSVWLQEYDMQRKNAYGKLDTQTQYRISTQDRRNSMTTPTSKFCETPAPSS